MAGVYPILRCTTENVPPNPRVFFEWTQCGWRKKTPKRCTFFNPNAALVSWCVQNTFEHDPDILRNIVQAYAPEKMTFMRLNQPEHKRVKSKLCCFYPLVICYIAIEKWPYIVDFPSYKMVDFSIAMLNYQRVKANFCWLKSSVPVADGSTAGQDEPLLSLIAQEARKKLATRRHGSPMGEEWLFQM
jgi:hypothetical protein